MVPTRKEGAASNDSEGIARMRFQQPWPPTPCAEVVALADLAGTQAPLEPRLERVNRP